MVLSLLLGLGVMTLTVLLGNTGKCKLGSWSAGCWPGGNTKLYWWSGEYGGWGGRMTALSPPPPERAWLRLWGCSCLADGKWETGVLRCTGGGTAGPLGRGVEALVAVDRGVEEALDGMRGMGTESAVVVTANSKAVSNWVLGTSVHCLVVSLLVASVLLVTGEHQGWEVWLTGITLDKVQASKSSTFLTFFHLSARAPHDSLGKLSQILKNFWWLLQ